MTLPIVPYTFRSGHTLSPTALNTNLQQLERDINRSLDQRYFYSAFTLDFSDSGAITGERNTVRIRPPFAIEIVGVEVHGYGDISSNVTIAATGSGLSGWEDLTVFLDSVNTVRGTTFANFVAYNTASSEIAFSATSTDGADFDELVVTVHIRVDRGNAGSSHAPFQPTLVNGATTTTNLRTNLNTLFTDAAAAVARDTANDVQLRIQVLQRRDNPTAANGTFRIPATGKRLHSFDHYCYAAVSGTGRVTITDPVGPTNYQITNAVVAGYNRENQTPGATQATAPTTSASDWTVTFEATAGTVTHQYAVLYWT